MRALKIAHGASSRAAGQVRRASIRGKLRATVQEARLKGRYVEDAERAFAQAERAMEAAEGLVEKLRAGELRRSKKTVDQQVAKARRTFEAKRVVCQAAQQRYEVVLEKGEAAQLRLDRRRVILKDLTSAFRVFAARFLKGDDPSKADNPSKADFREAHLYWKSLSAEEREHYEAQAKHNRQARILEIDEGNKAKQKKDSPYKLFYRAHYATIYRDAVADGADKKAAWAFTMQEVNRRWKESQEPK
eukprot:Hpha_TRINITY_DN13234_c0_g2::TRINITY_DN13234_c0_g2_i1::g.155103::m.155103